MVYGILLKFYYGGKRMKFLILSCNTGGGHNTAAMALKQAAENMGHEALLLDFLLLSGQKTSNRISSLYINTAKRLPHVFGAAYTLGKWVSYVPGKSPIYFFNKKRAEALYGYIKEHNFDAVLTTHLFAAEALTCIKRRGLKLPLTVAVATDYTCIPFWDEVECDIYISPHEELAGEYIKRKLPKENIYPCGIPVDARFSERKPKKEAKQELGFDPERPLYLIMSGSMGFGHVPMFAKLLCRYTENGQVAIICGTNEKLREKLEKVFDGNKDVRVVGFTENVPDYMAACDVIYTKPGGLTSTEALVSGTPIIHTAPIPGCESKNYRFFGKKGLSLHAKNMVTQILCGKALVENIEKRDRMTEQQRKNSKPDSAKNIISLAVSMCDERKKQVGCERGNSK